MKPDRTKWKAQDRASRERHIRDNAGYSSRRNDAPIPATLRVDPHQPIHHQQNSVNPPPARRPGIERALPRTTESFRTDLQRKVLEKIIMIELNKVPYNVKVHTTGGREGDARSGDSRLDIKLSPPGIPGTSTNPEQLFGIGSSACFLGAVKIVAGKRKAMLPAGTAIDAEVDLCIAEGAYFLKACLNVSLPGLAREVAQALADEAQQTHPYSKATTSTSRSTLSIPN
jgi:osmotically inducible protein OsmC